ncbi:MAG: sensor histidine kinase [Saprospiraceae bacterium]|nr:sensor histidine kinase [Saprospiraceae bacterium]
MEIGVHQILSRKFTIGLILLMMLGNISAQAMDCDDLGLEKEYTLLKKLNRSKNNFKAIILADSLLAIISKNGKSTCKLRFQIEIEKGESFELQSKFEDAMNLYYNLIRDAEPLTYWDMVAKAHISLARIQEFIDRSGDCLHHLKLANTLIQEHRLLNIESYYCVRYSSYLRSINKDSSWLYAQKAVELGRRDTNNKSIADGNLLLGILANEVDTSIFYNKRAIDAYLLDNDYRVAAEVANNIARKLLKVGKINESMEQLAYASQLIEQMPVNDELYYEVLGRIHRIKTTIFEKKNMIDSAYFYLKKSNENEAKSKLIIDKQTVTNNAINFAIEKEQDKLKTSEKIGRILKVSLGVMSVLILALVWAVFSNYYKRNKIAAQNKKINEADQKKAVLLTEIHHRVKNNLQLVIGLMTIYGNKKENHQLKTYFDEISTKINSISIIHDQLSTSGEFEKLDMKVYLENLINNFKNLFTAQNQFLTEYDVQEIHLNIETVLPLGIIFTELISNSLKHSNPGQETSIKVSITRVEEKYVLVYADNGPGYHETHTTKGDKHKLGLSLINNMVRQLQAEHCHYNDNGAVFKMIFQEKTVSKI